MIEILVVCEDRADAETATDLADRILREEGPDWIEDAIEHVRRWRGVATDRAFLRWRELKAEYAKRSLPRHLGHRLGKVKGADVAIARKAALLAERLRRDQPAVRALLLVRDLDHQPERRDGLVHGGEIAEKRGITTILATPDPKREAWVLHGFEPDDDREAEALAEEKRKIEFDPRFEAHRLRGDRRQATGPRDPKRIVESLTGKSWERESRCWREPPLDRLAERGEHTRLAAYLDEVREKLLPLVVRGRGRA